MHNTRTLFVFSAFFISGCGPQATMHIQVATAPDLAIYDGVYFESRDGMKTYEDIVLVPRLLRDKVPVVLPDGSNIDVRDVSADVFRAHGVSLEVNQDDGRGSYTFVCNGLHAIVTSGRTTRVDLMSVPLDPSLFSVQFKGHNIAVPIKRAALEALLGVPDEIKLDTYAPAN